MTKNFAIIAAAVLTLAACSKEAPEGEINFEAPKNLKEAVSISLPSGGGLKTIDLMESGNYLITTDAQRSVSGSAYLYGTYTFSNGVYTLSGDYTGTVTLAGDTVSAEGSYSAEGKVVEVSVNACKEAKVTKADENLSSEENQLCREWQVKATRAMAVTAGVKIDMTWDGCDLNKISADLAEKMDFKFSVPDGLNLESVTFTQFGKLVLRFESGESYVAEWKFGNNKNSLLHNWLEDYMSIEILKSASITVSYNQEGVIIRFTASINETDDCAVSIGLVEKK